MGGDCRKCGAKRADLQLGLEKTPEEYVAKMVEVFREVRRVLRDDGTLWLNLGDSYNAYNGNAGPGSGFSAGSACDTERPHLETGHGLRTRGLKPKDLVGIPWRVAFALQADGWYLRQDIIWHKPNPMPESVTDRCTKAHEYIFLMAKSQKYYFDSESIKEPCASGPSDIRKMQESLQRIDAKHFHSDPGPLPAANPRTNIGNKRAVGDPSGRNRRSVWTQATQPFRGAHFATFPPDLIEPMIKAGCPVGGTVLDPFFGAGTTGVVSARLRRGCVGIELSADYIQMAERRIRAVEAQLTLPKIDEDTA
jgi:DNA modification methylase